MRMKTILTFISIFILFVLSYGQNISWFQSADLNPKGTAEIIPFTSYYDDGGAFRPAWGILYGMQFVYGTTDKINLTFRSTSYCHVFPDDRINFAYIGLAAKFRIIPDRISFSVPIGLNLSEYFNVQVDAKLHISWNIRNAVNLTVSPGIAVLVGGINTGAFGSDINFGIPLGKRTSQLVFESGAYVWPGSEWQPYYFGGIGLRFGVW